MALSNDSFFAPTRDSHHSLHVGASFRFLQQHFSSKSGSGKYAQLIVESDRVYLPGSEIRATIAISPNTVSEVESLEVDFKAEVHTFGYVYARAGVGAGSQRQRRLRIEKDLLFASSAVVQVPSLQSRQTSGVMSIWQKGPEDPLLLEAESRLPSSIVWNRDHTRQVPLPCTYHDGSFGSQTALITYHWKTTVHRKGALKTDERQWKPIMVVGLTECPNNDTLLAQSLSYPPGPMMGVRGMYREVKKYMVKTTGLMEIELALPLLTNHPLFRPVPIIVRVSVRAKSPSDLLQTGSLPLPDLPDDSQVKSVGPQFVIRRYRRTQVDGSSVETTWEKSKCKCKWDSSHLTNGFTQQPNGMGYEAGREGSTPVADKRARAGLSHGWTWPARSDPGSDPAFFSTPTTSFPKPPLSTSLLPGSSQPPNSDALRAFQYVTTSTLFAMVYLYAHPNINVSHLSVFSDLHLEWKMEGARNNVDTRIEAVNVNMALDGLQAGLIHQDELKRAIWNPESLSEQGPLLQGPLPPPPAFPTSADVQLPSYPGRSQP